MKTLSTGYSFNAAGKTITFSGQIPPSLESILSVVNYSTGQMMFQPQGGAALSGTWASPILTLSCDTTGMANGNRLLIIFDDGASAATAAKQDTGNSSLASIDGKLPALSGGRVPVDVGTSVEVSNDSGNPVPVSGTVTANAGTNLNTSALVLESGGNLATLVSRIPTLTIASTRLLIDGSGVTQPISATSLPLPAGAATAAKQPALGTAGTPSADVISVQGITSGTPLPTSGFAYRFAGTFTRPANQTPYTAGDVIGDTGGSAIITLTNIGPAGGSVIIQSIRLLIYSGTLPTSMTTLRLHFYNASPTAIADNAAWDLVSGDRSAYLDYIDLPTPTDMGSTLFTKFDWPGSQLRLANGVTSLYCLIQTATAATFAENSTVLDLRVNTYEAGR